MSKNKAVAAPKSGAVVPFSYGEDAGQGSNISLDDILVPFLGLLQKDSKECVEDEGAFIEGAEAGLIVNKATRELYDGKEGIVLVPVDRQKTYEEFIDRDNGGGWVASHEPGSTIVKDALANATNINDLRTESGNQLVETRTLFCVMLDGDGDGVLGWCVVPFTSSKITPYKGFWTQVDTVRYPKGEEPPLFAYRIHLSAKDDKNKVGQRYKNYVVKPFGGSIQSCLLNPDSDAYAAGKELREHVLSGRATADRSTEVAEPNKVKGEAAEADAAFA